MTATEAERIEILYEKIRTIEKEDFGREGSPLLNQVSLETAVDIRTRFEVMPLNEFKVWYQAFCQGLLEDAKVE